MPLFHFTEAEERIVMKRLFDYIYLRALRNSDRLVHNSETTWEHVCRFLAHFDPLGLVSRGYEATKTSEEIGEMIETNALTSLPCLEAFLDLALSMSNHVHGIDVTIFSDPMGYDPTLEPILHDLALLDPKGVPSKPLLLDAISNLYFFNVETSEFCDTADRFLDQVAAETWQNAPVKRKDLLLSKSEGGKYKVQNWLKGEWCFGVWLSDAEVTRNNYIMYGHWALDWQIMMKIQEGLKERRYQI